MTGWILWAPVVTATAALIGLAVAVVTLLTNRRLARLKATIDHIDAANTRPPYMDAYAAFRRYRRDAAFAQRIDDPVSDDDFVERGRCLDFLNHYEVASIACQSGLFDEQVYRDWVGPVLLRDWQAASPLIQTVRVPTSENLPANPSAYINFERLARRWGGKPLS